MTICMIVLKNEQQAYELKEKLSSISASILKFELIAPSNTNQKINFASSEKSISTSIKSDSYTLKKNNINDIKLLNPKLSRNERQKKMVLWLMPFGFIAGITFAGMTNLTTFSRFGFNSFWETIFGGFLGMVSGWIGSFFASASVNTNKQDIDSLRKLNEKGFWLILLETPFETEPPWNIIKQIDPEDVVSMNQL